MSLEFLLEAPRLSGRGGGIFPIIQSTLWILGIAIAIALPVALAIALWQSEFAKFYHPSVYGWVRLALDVLAGVPSIVYGLFGYAFFCVFLGFGYSILAGGLTLACMILPLLASILEVAFSSHDAGSRQGGLALGLSQFGFIRRILIPSHLPAIAAGVSLALGRATAETAALLFTSGYVDRAPESIFDSGRALSVHIYDLAMNVTGGDQAAYASALVLICLIIAIHSIAQRLILWK